MYKRTVTNKYGLTFEISKRQIVITYGLRKVKFKNRDELDKKLKVVFLDQISKKKVSEYMLAERRKFYE